MAVAALLRQTRENLGLTLEQLAEETRIPVDRLAAFERDGLPPDSGFYHRAWIRTYAHALGLDDRGFVTAIDHDLAVAAAAAPPEAALRQVHGWPLLGVFCCVVAAACIAGAVLLSSQQQPRETVQARPASVAVVAAVRDERRVPPLVPASLATGGLVEPDAAPPPLAVASTPTITQLVITSKPVGARVTVDGIGWGTTPVTIRHLPEGVKRIRVTHDGYAASERVVEVQPERVNRISVQLRSLRRAGE